MTVKELRSILNELDAKYDDAEFEIVTHGEFNDVSKVSLSTQEVYTDMTLTATKTIDCVVLETSDFSRKNK